MAGLPIALRLHSAGFGETAIKNTVKPDLVLALRDLLALPTVVSALEKAMAALPSTSGDSTAPKPYGGPSPISSQTSPQLVAPGNQTAECSTAYDLASPPLDARTAGCSPASGKESASLSLVNGNRPPVCKHLYQGRNCPDETNCNKTHIPLCVSPECLASPSGRLDKCMKGFHARRKKAKPNNAGSNSSNSDRGNSVRGKRPPPHKSAPLPSKTKTRAKWIHPLEAENRVLKERIRLVSTPVASYASVVSSLKSNAPKPRPTPKPVASSAPSGHALPSELSDVVAVAMEALKALAAALSS